MGVLWLLDGNRQPCQSRLPRVRSICCVSQNFHPAPPCTVSSKMFCCGFKYLPYLTYPSIFKRGNWFPVREMGQSEVASRWGLCTTGIKPHLFTSGVNICLSLCRFWRNNAHRSNFEIGWCIIITQNGLCSHVVLLGLQFGTCSLLQLTGSFVVIFWSICHDHRKI